MLNMNQEATNGLEFDEEIQDIEESMPGYSPSSLISAENQFLSIVLAVAIMLGLAIYCISKKRHSRSVDSQVSKYKSLSANYGDVASLRTNGL